MTNQDLTNLLALGEGFTTEFKRSGTNHLGREICAFANATGGIILIGVTDEGKVTGVNDHNRLKSEILSIARSAEPPIAVDIESIDDVLCVTVPEQHSKPYSFGGKFFFREGASSQQMSRDEIREFFFKEGLIHFDETPCPGYSLTQDLTPEIWRRFAERAHIPPTITPETALRNLHLIKDNKMTHAGAWLLCDDITKYTLRAGVTCALFRGTTSVHILDRKDFTGDLYSIYADCMAYLQSKLNTALIPHAKGRDERLELPEEALREALVNALAHRDYRSAANVQVHLYHDRLEIITPGGLPAGISKEELGSKSLPRNPLLFSMFYRMNLVEQIGSGIQRIRDLCRDYGIAQPAFEVSQGWVTITFFRANAPTIDSPGHKTEPNKAEMISKEKPTQSATQSPTQLQSKSPTQSDPIEKVVTVLRQYGPLSAAELRKKLGLNHRPTFRHNYLHPALKQGVIEMTVPEKPTSRLQRYRLTKKDN